MDKTWYIDECNRQLNDSKFYRRLNEDITVDIQKRVTVYVNRMYTDDLIDEKTKQYLIQPDVKRGRFYILSKVHKLGNPGRPIVSSNRHLTERISHFIDHSDTLTKVRVNQSRIETPLLFVAGNRRPIIWR